MQALEVAMKAAESGTVGPGPSTVIREYMDGKISSSEYFRVVREETSRQVERELAESNGADESTSTEEPKK